MRVKDLAYKIMDRRVIPFLKFDTRVARNRLFMCIFNDHDPFNEHEMGVHMVDGDVSEVAKLMRSFQVEALDQLIVRIGRVNKASDENLINSLYTMRSITGYIFLIRDFLQQSIVKPLMLVIIEER